MNISNYKNMTISELEKKYPVLPWLEFFRSFFDWNELEDREIVNIFLPEHLTQLEVLLKKTSKKY